MARYPGVYVSPKPFFDRITILVLNQLRDLPHNQYFRLFASKKKVRESALSYLIAAHEQAYLANQDTNGEKYPEDMLMLTDDQLEEKWSVLYGLRTIYKLEGIRMDIEMSLEEVLEMGRKEYLKSMLELVPARERIAELDPQERMAGLDPQERLAGLDPQERLAGLDTKEIVHALEPENMVRLMQEIESFLANQKATPSNEVDVSEPEEPVGDSLFDDQAD